MRFNGEWLDMAMEELFAPGAHGDRRADPRARRLRQALRRARADLGARAALSAACRATTRSPCAPTSSSAAPTRSSTCCSGATCSARTASRSRSCSRCRSCRRRRRAEDVEVAGQPDRGDRVARGDVREDDAHPGRPRWTAGTELLLGEEPPPRLSGRATPSTRSRARSWRGSTARRRGRRRPRRTSTRVFVQREEPEDIDEVVVPGTAPVHLPAVHRRAHSAARARRPAGCCRQGGGAAGRRAARRRGPRRAGGAARRPRRAGRASVSSGACASRPSPASAGAVRRALYARRPARWSAPAAQERWMVLVCVGPSAEPAALRASARGRPSRRAARRSLKTQQHAHLGSTRSVCQVRCPSTPAGSRREPEIRSTRHRPSAGTCTRRAHAGHDNSHDSRALRQSSSYFTESLILAQDERWRRA